MTLQKRTSKKRRIKKQKSERQLIDDNLETYNQYLKIGYTREQAVKKLKSQPRLPSLGKLKARYERNLRQPGAIGISLK